MIIEGSIVSHSSFGTGKVKHMSEEKIIVDFGRFDITFLPIQFRELVIK